MFDRRAPGFLEHNEAGVADRFPDGCPGLWLVEDHWSGAPFATCSTCKAVHVATPGALYASQRETGLAHMLRMLDGSDPTGRSRNKLAWACVVSVMRMDCDMRVGAWGDGFMLWRRMQKTRTG